MKKEMMINVLQPEECRIAILEDGVLEELYVERTSRESYVGNIYKGRIVNIEPSIQAAFVDFGVGRNGFLHVSDVEPAYYRHLEQRRGDQGRGDQNSRRGGRDRDSERGRGRGRDRDRDRNRNQGRGERPLNEEWVSEADMVADAPAEGLAGAPTQPPNDPVGGNDFAFNAPDRPNELKGEERFEIPQASPAIGEFDEPDELPVRTAPITTGEEENRAKAEDENRGRRRRSRGRGRGRGRREAPEAAAHEDHGAPGEAFPASDEPPPSPPEPMQSAERRTKNDDPSDSPPASLAELTDDDLSFSRPSPSRPHQPPRREETPSFYSAPEVPEYEPLEPLLPAEDSQPAPVNESDFDPQPQPEAASVEAESSDDLVDDYADERMAEFDEDSGVSQRHGDRHDEGGGRRDEGGPRDRDRRRRRPMGGRMGVGRPKPLIQDIFKRGQEVLVQVIKEGIGTKGPTLSTYISIAGRYLVLMPGLNRIGVSRKIADDDQRRRLRDILSELEPPKGLGFIIRTAGLDRTKKELQRDLAYLSRLWQVVVRRIRKVRAPAEIYQESDMIIRTIRDTFTSEIDTIWVDEPNAFAHAQEFLQIVMPRYANRIKSYTEPEPMFHKYGIETEIARIQRRHVPLPMGGSIVIDQTEALVAIDVNSGNFRADNNAEETAYQMNLQAAKEIARQLRLRDLGGVIVNDFIDMRDDKHRRGVEKAMRDAVKRDRARTKILKISQFGIIEMTRQRIRPSLKRSVYQECPHCGSSGQVKTTESMSIDVMRMLQLAVHRPNIQRIEIKVHQDVANYLQNHKRKAISQLEDKGTTTVLVVGDPVAPPEKLDFVCYDNNNSEVKFLPGEEPARSHRR